jgi:hypothetical protein
MAERFPIRYSPGHGVMLSVLGLPRAVSYVELDGDRLRVRMGWAFRADVTRAAVRRAAGEPALRPISVGTHGWRGKWLVNGARSGLVRLELDEGRKARVLGIPVRLRVLRVSMEDPERFLARLGAP